MGSLVPIITGAALSGTARALSGQSSGRVSEAAQELALQQLKAQQNLQEAQSAADARAERERISLASAQDEEERKSALKRAVARQRASFGSQGVGAGGGSSQAVLLGLFDESEEEQVRRDALDALRLNAIDQDLRQEKSLNVLQRTQLEERQNLSAASRDSGFFGGLF